MTDWVVFFAAAATIVVAGSALARCADAIAARTGWGRVWVGAIALATVTSLPELATDVSAVRIDAPDLAAGDLFGSSMANMAILTGIVLAFPARRGRVGAMLGHATHAGTAVALTSLAAIFVLADRELAVRSLGLGSVLIALLYGLASWQMSRPAVLREFSEVIGAEEETVAEATTIGLRAAVLRFAAAAIAIAVAGPLLAVAAEGLADDLGVADSFFGALALAVATSLPELSSSIAAVRMGATDLAYGNLFGSNAVNMAIFLVLDIAYTDGSLLARIDGAQALTASGAILMTALGAGLVLLQVRRQRGPAVTLSASMLLLYAMVLALAA